MEEGEDAGTKHGENGHGFGGPVNRCSPLLLEQTKHRRNQSTRMTNSDPKNEIYNRPAPIDWIVVTPNSNSRGNQINKTHAREASYTQG